MDPVNRMNLRTQVKTDAVQIPPNASWDITKHQPERFLQVHKLSSRIRKIPLWILGIAKSQARPFGFCLREKMGGRRQTEMFLQVLKLSLWKRKKYL